jgi:flagellar protein FlgJ
VTTPVSTPAPIATAKGADDTSRLASRTNLEAAGRRFEAVFDGMMLKAMRNAQLANPLFDSKALDTFRDMQDKQIAQTMSENAPIGIGKAMVDFLSKSRADLQTPAPPSPDVGPVADSGNAASLIGGSS